MTINLLSTILISCGFVFCSTNGPIKENNYSYDETQNVSNLYLEGETESVYNSTIDYYTWRFHSVDELNYFMRYFALDFYEDYEYDLTARHNFYYVVYIDNQHVSSGDGYKFDLGTYDNSGNEYYSIRTRAGDTAYYFNNLDFEYELRLALYLKTLPKITKHNVFRYSGYLASETTESYRYEAYLPPQIEINRNTESFYIDLGFEYNYERYFAIEYKKGEYLAFVRDSDLSLLKANRTISTNGDYIFSFGNTTLDNSTFNLIAFSKESITFIRDYLFIPGQLLNGRYSFNTLNALDYWLEVTPQLGNSIYLYNIEVYSNGEYFSGIYIKSSDVGYSANDNGVIDYYSLNFELGLFKTSDILTPFYRYYLELDYGDYNVRKRTLTYQDTTRQYFNLVDVPLTEPHFNIIVNFLNLDYYILENIDNDVFVDLGVWDIIGGAFASLGGILGVYIFPGITLGLLLGIPFFALILFFIIGLFKR